MSNEICKYTHPGISTYTEPLTAAPADGTLSNTFIICFSDREGCSDSLAKLIMDGRLIGFSFIGKDGKSNLSKVKKQILKLKKIHNHLNTLIILDYLNSPCFKNTEAIISAIIMLFEMDRKYKIPFGINTNGQTSYININKQSESNEELLFQLVAAVNACLTADLKESYEYIYDIVCDYLDSEFEKHNYCNFIDNNCELGQSKGVVNTKGVGCCYSYKLFRFLTIDFMYDHKPCENLKNCHCAIKCISCKLFTCECLKKRGIKFTPENILLLKCFFNRKQRLILRYNIFRTKELIIDKLLKCRKNMTPFIFYFLNRSYLIT